MIDKKIERANLLMESLPYIKEFSGKTIVIKYGGNAMIDENIKDSIVHDIVLMKYVGMNPVVVHGGGPEINCFMKKNSIETKFEMGNRVTTDEAMEIVEMVLAGKVNKDIVNRINQAGGKAVGLSGKDASMITAKKKYIQNGENKIDIGCVGDVEKIDPNMIQILEKEGYITVVSPIGVDKLGNTYNINADYVAGELAGALNAYKFILMTNVKGVLTDIEKDESLISELTTKEIDNLINNGTIEGGMLPKVDACMTALKKGARKAHIIDGRIKHALLLELFTDDGIGTMIKKDDGEKNEI